MAATNTPDNADLLTLARTIYGEARGDSPAEREAIAHVIMNRVNGKGFPKTISEVCRQPKQFSCWNEGDPNRKLIESMLPGANPVFDECLATAERVMNGTVADTTGGATHYYSKVIGAPGWTKGADLTTEIGILKFYRNVG
jgi:spore germination cell wall hydrolase CwlJ-like protein